MKPWWWNDPETRAWIASGACCCPSCKQDRKLMAERPMPKPRTPDPALPNEAGKLPVDRVEWRTVAENLGKELTIERNWRIRLQEELWALDPSKDPRRAASHEHVYRCQDCGEIGRAPDRDWDAEPMLYDPDTGTHEA